MFGLLMFAPLAPYVITLIVIGAVLGIVAIWLALCAVIAFRTLKTATKPVAHTRLQGRGVQKNNRKRAENFGLSLPRL